MVENTDQTAMIERTWRHILIQGITEKDKRLRKIFKLIHSEEKCKMCSVPFNHVTSPLIKLIFQKEPSPHNPRFCNACEDFARKHQGGAEIELTMLFADIRGSTTLAESMSTTEFKNLIDRFYQVTTEIFIRSDALIDKLVGDEVTAFFVPGMAGTDYASRAVHAAKEILVKTGHQDAQGPWAPVGIGVHTGVAFVGAVGSSDGMVDVTALGDAVNTAARLASQAQAGEILVSEQTVQAAHLDAGSLEKRSLALKGKSEPFDVRVLRI